MELTKTINDWGLFDTSINFLKIAGPCSAESEEQMLTIAKSLNHNDANLFRAGIWKPRTRPGSFEGYGEESLKWLSEVKKQYGHKTTVEVASADHVELALKYGVDVLWLGARTTVNPFSVQEIAESLKGVDIPVMVKNPMNPDLALWIGSIERLYKCGITKLAAIHRGFSTHEIYKYRNMPMWNIPIELKRQFPKLPMIIDPSHIAGKREYLQQIAQRGINFGADGMIVEVHNNPDIALSDREQQLTPEGYDNFLKSLTFKNKETFLSTSLEKYRSAIDELISTLVDRMKIVKKVGEYKKIHNVPIVDTKRFDEILRSKAENAKQYGVSEKFIIELFSLIHTESVNIQENE